MLPVSPRSPLTVRIGEDKLACCRTLRQQLSCTDARAATNALHPSTSLTLNHNRRRLASSFFRSSERARAFTERWLSKVNLIIFDTERREDGEVLLLNECARSALPPSRFWRAKKIIEQTSGIYLPPSGDTMPTQPFCIDYAMFPC